MTPQPYPDEPSWWTQTLEEIGSLYESVGQTFNLGMFKWGTRIAYDIADGMEKDASKAKHFKELRKELGIDVIVKPGETVARTDVHLVDRCWNDSNGPFRPVGTTFFWALGGWHRRDQARVKENFAWMQQNHLDYFRMLGKVDWKGEEIDPSWPEYPQELAELLDTAYMQFGLQAQVTVTGGGADPVKAATIIRDVVAPRLQTVIMFEAANEDNASEEEAIAICKILAPLGIPVGVGLGDQGIAEIKTCGDLAKATLDFYHTERTVGDNGARQVRQCWNFKEFKHASVDNEPPGIASSVAELKDPFKMAAKRAGDIICGGEAFCVHAGAGVFGRRMVTTNGLLREANLSEVPGLDEMVAAVRMADAHLPPSMVGWTKFNVNQPIKGVSGTINKLYGSRKDNQFAEIAIGCEGESNVFEAKEAACDVVVANPATGETQQFSLKKNDTFQVSGLWAYVIVGTFT